MYATPDLDRSPSLSSNSSAASSAGTQPPITPALSSVSTFPSPSKTAATSDFGTPLGKSPFPRLSPSKTPTSGSKPSPWSAGHRTGAGSQSFDAARAAFANLDNSGGSAPSPILRPSPFGGDSSYRPSSPGSFRTGSPVRDGASSPTRSTSPVRFGTPGSPTRRFGSTSARPPLPSIPSDRPSYSPSHGSPALGSTSRNSPSLSGSASARVLSSAIFSTRDGSGLDRSGVGSVRRFEKGHRRAMTLPQLGADGLPLPGVGADDGVAKAVGALTIEEDVPGLPGRARLSRPAETASPFAPSAVFNSSHGGLARAANGLSKGPPVRSATTLLPSQAVKAIDRQRHDLVAYEYLCHLAEARDWLEDNITTRADDSPPLWSDSINDFEQSLRNGYALAHLARSLGGPACQGPIYADPVRHFRHTVNINLFFHLVNEVGLPEIFRFETVDLYDAKNLLKVIYCLHALSHLMARRGLTSKMTDLVGQIDFTDDEVGAAQKGLNGVRMPNFRGIGKALDKHEPPIAEEVRETPEERTARELAAAEGGITALQAHARGVLARRAAERERQRVRAEERRRLAEEAERERARAEEEARVRREEEEAAERRRVAEEEERRRLAAEEAARLRAEAEERARQEAEDARLAAEEEERQYQAEVREAARTLVGFQAVARGALVRRRFYAPIEQLAHHQPQVIALQAAARGLLARRALGQRVRELRAAEPGVTALQAACRGVLARQNLLGRIRQLRTTEDFIVGVQAHIRGQLARRSFAGKARDLRKTEVVRSVGGLQSLARAALARRRVQTQRQQLGFVEPDVVGIQAQTRGYLGRNAFLDWRENLYRNEPTVVFLQSMMRGALARRRYYDLHRHFHENLAQVVRLQAAIRSRRQGSQYRQLRKGTNVPVSTIKNFMRLLDDSEFDYRGELQVESLRKELVGAIREKKELEDDVKDLDTKIALLVKNKITHEVARAQRSKLGTLAPLKRSSLLSAANDPFAGGALDHHTQRKLELYEQLFTRLQTEPQYLSRLFANTGALGMSEKAQKAVESITLLVFSHAQGHREEFLLLKLFQRSVQEEVAALPNLSAFIRGNFTFLRLFVNYGRGVNQRSYLANTLGAEVKAVMSRQGLDLGTNPVDIYRNAVAQEEMKTGRPSQRRKEVDHAHALADRETNNVFIQHLLALRKTTTAFLAAIFRSTPAMPFGVRYVAREIFRALRAQFPQESEENVLRVAGHVVYYRFLQPAIFAPETYDIVEGVVPPIQRQNLGEVGKLLHQISIGRLFEEDQSHLRPMNDFVATSWASFRQWLCDVVHVEDAETHFHADEFSEAAAVRRPKINITPNEIYQLHSIIAENLDTVAPEAQDPVRRIVEELGGVPAGGSAELNRARADAIALTLAPRVLPEEDPEAITKQLFNRAKRRVLAILKVHHGNDLEAVLAQQVTEEEEDLWARLVDEEEEEERRQAHAQRRSVVPQMDDIRNMSFQQLKMATLGDILELRETGLVSKNDKYQAILNAIARDIRSKHHRRVQRQQELQTMHATLAALRDNKRYLSDQINSYHVYIDQSMAGIQKKSKKRLVLPWSLQASHERQLDKEGKKYAFGSYKYTAQKLYDQKILLSIDQYSPKQFDKVSITISSDEIGVFEVKAQYMGVTVTTVEIRLEDLLEMQFAGKTTLSIGDVAKTDLPLTIGLINRKFYQ
ncbi:iqgap-related protein [Rhodotorula kratochvilovae]